MSERTISQKLLAVSLSLLLASCSVSQQVLMAPSRPQELTRYMLIIEELSGGHLVHTWRPITDFDMEKARGVPSPRRFSGNIVRTGTDIAHCNSKQTACIAICTASPIPIPIEGEEFQEEPEKWLKHRGRWCQSTCTKFHEQCVRGWGPWAERTAQVHEFKAIDTAVDWIKAHRDEIVEGTVVVIAGVALVAAIVYSGGTILYFTPVLALASAEHPSSQDPVSQSSERMNANP